MRRRRRPAMSIVKRMTSRLAVIMMAATAVAVAAASPSYADTVITPTDALATSTAGYAYFNADTEVLSLHDSHADGYGILLIYYRYDLANDGPYYMWNREGNGTTLYRQLSMPPLAKIKLYACPEQNGIALDWECGARAFGYAGRII